jgi:RNA polymerase sigma-70 factor (ECF subfamily)
MAVQVAHGETFIQSLYDDHSRALLAYATSMTGDRSTAEDVLQETLLRAWRNPAAFAEGKGSARGWLLTVSRNLITDHARARAVRPAVVAVTDESSAATAAQRDHAQTVVDSIVVLEALGTLPVDHRRVLGEIYFRGHTAGEAATKLGIPEGTVKSRCHNALRALREVLDQAQSERVC